MKSKVTLTVFLSLVVVVLVFFNARAILRPAKYKAIYEERSELNKDRLTIIKTLQELYRERYHNYAPHIDSLICFYERDSIFRTSTVDTPPADSLENEDFMDKFNNMSHDERVKYGYAKDVVYKVSVKERMKVELDDLNANRAGRLATMKDFYLIPYKNTKYKIEVPSTDSVVSKFAVYVPIEDMMANFNESVPQSFFMKGFYGHMDDVYNPQIKDKSYKDLREVRDFAGLQLGDTVKNSTEIKEYGGKN